MDKDKILKRLLVSLWIIFGVLMLGLEIANLKYGTLLAWVKDIIKLSLLILYVLSVLYYIKVVFIDKKKNGENLAALIAMSIFLTLHILLMLFGMLFQGNHDEKIEYINGRKYVVDSVLGYQDVVLDEYIYEYQNCFFRGEVLISRSEIALNVTETTGDISETATSEPVTTVTEGISTRYKDPEIAKIYREVLKSERTFVSVAEGNRDVLIDNYNFYRGSNVECLIKPIFSFIDINDDDNFEVVVQVTTEENYPDGKELLILYCEGEVVYGYRIPEGINVYGDNVFRWNSLNYVGNYQSYYTGYGRIDIEEKELMLTYVFEEKGSDEEKWLRDNNIITAYQSVEYVGDEYSKYENPTRKREYGHELNENNIEQYVR